MTTFPDWTGFTPDFAQRELERLLPAAESKIAALEASEPKTFGQLIYPLNDAVRDLWSTWGMVLHELSVCNSPAWRKVQEAYQGRIVEFSLRVSQSPKLYAHSTRVACRLPVEKRIIEKMILGARLSGVALKGKKKERFNEIQSALAKLGTDFSNAVIDATDKEISDAKYVETMKFCKNRRKRQRIYMKRISRAPENGARILEILKLRAECAKLLGFANFAEESLASKCAPSVQAVLDMIDELDRATKKISLKEDAELRAMMEDAQPWDLAFLAEKLREAKYSYSEEELKRHFEFADVLKGLFKICNFLFGIEVEELAGRDKPPVWHKDVRVFRVVAKGKTLSHFYLDAYARPGTKSGGAWMNEFRNRSRRLKELPLAVIVLNLKEPDQDGKSLMPFRDVETLFHEFGHACQQMLTTVGEEDAAGINLVEWDAVEVASQFMENWCLDDRTGIEVPAGLKAKVKAAKNFRAASACRRQLALAKTDLMLHLKRVKDPNALKEKVFAHFGMPIVPEDRFLNAFTHIFSGGYSAGYYGYKWSEVMSADVYGAFEEAGLGNDAKMRKLGKKYRDTILAMGGSESALDVFKRFRGRAPAIDAILRQQGLK
ncbi:MAG: M3 family metallopeptidase [Kiritimatiellae bacterium]|nr:M3 family metallopeptidase [Kiritimatiellia bacterium]